MKLTQIEKCFVDVGVVKGGVFLLRVTDAIRFITQCRTERVAISGIEGFRMIGDKVQPLQEHSIDFGDDIANTHDRSEAFLSERLSDDLWFEVVAAERDE